MGPSARLLRLLSLLQTPREWSGSELAERLEVSPRTIRHDIDRLRALGYPVRATRGSVGGYRLEGLGAQLFSAVRGDYFTILGLPLLPLLGFLREHGVVPS